jgi:hypothetical protein
VKRRALLALIRLGAVAGAICYAAPARAQGTTPVAAETPLPVKPKTDSIPDSSKVKPDTIKAPVGRYVDPSVADQSAKNEWNREEMFASGALTLIDLLDHVPEVTTFRSGWISTPQTAVYNGDPRRVRVFVDDVEMDALNGRDGGVMDLSTVPLWTLEHVTLERSADELRIYLRTWRVDRTTPYTRTDILTGTPDTQIYRGYYGKRYDRGQIFQAAGEKYATTNPRTAGSGDALSLLLRTGIARKSWSVDAYATRTHLTRETQLAFFTNPQPAIPPLNATSTLAYIRAGLGHPEHGPWLQIVAASQQFRESSPHTIGTPAAATTAGGIAVPRDSADTTRSSTQIVISGGLRLGPGRLTLQERMRTTEQRRDYGPTARLEVGSGMNVLSAYAESDALRHLTLTEVRAQLQPLRFIALSASAGHRNGSIEPGGGPATTALKGSIGVRVGRLWVTGGLINFDTTLRSAVRVYNPAFTPALVGRSTGVTTSVRGSIWKGIGTDSWVTHWSNPALNQPRYESRSELNYSNSFLKRFPTGDFGIKAAASMEYRGRLIFPTTGNLIGVGSARTLNGLFEIRILRAVVSYQQRNLLSRQYEIVPGFQMPRVLSVYGVRWEFWN